MALLGLPPFVNELSQVGQFLYIAHHKCMLQQLLAVGLKLGSLLKQASTNSLGGLLQFPSSIEVVVLWNEESNLHGMQFRMSP